MRNNKTPFYIILIISIFWASCFVIADEVIIRHPEISGRKAPVEKAGDDLGLGVVAQNKKYMVANKDDDASPNYYGFESADGAWFIMKWTVDPGNDIFQYKRGDEDYSTNWTNRASLTFKSYSEEF